MDELVGVLQIFSQLPSSWQIVVVVVFFLIPKLVNMVGGGDFVKNALSALGMTTKDIIRNYQSRKQMQAEDKSLTEAYTRTLVVESLSMFRAKLDEVNERLDEILNLMREKGE